MPTVAELATRYLDYVKLRNAAGMSAGALEILQQLTCYDGCPYVIPNLRTKKPWASFFHSWDTARKQAGLVEVHIHDLRRSCASYLVNAGRSLYEVQQILGHAQFRTTQIYAHLENATLIAAADAASAMARDAKPVLTLVEKNVPETAEEVRAAA